MRKTHNIWWQIQMCHGICRGPAVITRQPPCFTTVARAGHAAADYEAWHVWHADVASMSYMPF